MVVDFHGADLFPERWFDLVLVLRANNTVLFDRLTERGYAQKLVSNGNGGIERTTARTGRQHDTRRTASCLSRMQVA